LNRTYLDLIQQTYEFPQSPFGLQNNKLTYHGLPLHAIIDKFGTPLKMTYLPIIGEQIERARQLFGAAMKKHQYNNSYEASYCTKSSHFSHVLEEVLAHDSHIELSSAFDTDIVLHLQATGHISKDTYILCNGYKTPNYFEGIQRMLQAGFKNVIPILDCMSELRVYETFNVPTVNIGLRIATAEESQFDFYTSRFGIQQSKLLDFYQYRIKRHPKLQLKMLHFFVYSGVQDTTYYWNELHKYVKSYIQLKHLCPSLEFLNIGGGLPIKDSLEFEFDYEYMVDEIVHIIKSYCEEGGIQEPALFSEFGTFTVGEAGACLFKVLGTKQQNDQESWYMLDNTLISTLPDMWSKKQDFLMLPINKWDHSYQRANLGGLTCDNDDYYNSPSDGRELFLPKAHTEDVEPLYIGFFNTGAYQETLSGFGGVHHCLIPAPKQLLIDQDENGEHTFEVFAEQQQSEDALRLLGYGK